LQSRRKEAKKKGRSSNKRPKSREETPKEGSDSAIATALQQYVAALHKMQGVSDDLFQNYV
jgi:hypothetical protein